MLKHKLCKVSAILLTVLLVASVWSAGAFAASGDEVVLTVFHTNDQHGRMSAAPYVSQLAKDTAGNVLILDAGDALHGQIATNLSKGSAMVEVMNMAGYAAMAPGNHDFNFGFERLLELSKTMQFPLLSANVKKANGETLLQPYEVIHMDNLTVGIFGLSTPETLTKTDPRNVTGLTFASPSAIAAETVAALQNEGCDLIIALAHLGVDNATAQADRSSALVNIPGIDLIIDGHSHTRLESGNVAGDVLTVQTGAYGENIGMVTFTKTGDTYAKTAKLIAVPGPEDETDLVADQAVLDIIAEWEAQNESLVSHVVGESAFFLQGERSAVRIAETNLSNLIADSMRFATGADVAFLTGGNIRASIEAGDITMGDVLTTLPFSNLLMTVELTGADLLKVMEHGVSLYPEPAASFIQVSGMSFRFDPAAQAGSRVVSAFVGDEALDPAKVYTVASSEFLVAGGDGYTMMTDGKNTMYFQGDAEALVDYLATKPVITGEAEGRVSVIESGAVTLPAETPATAPPPVSEAIVTPVPPIAIDAVYVVKSGDVLWRIAQSYGTTWQELQRINNLANPHLIYPGQMIILPSGAGQSAA
ncbi:MAG: 5'-nucleotidase C-terminal domain-containing protein [Clostridiales bacterium]|nr:5'-nucleotidase C-terminal domain-containing protein [Clostridiales bacterium]